MNNKEKKYLIASTRSSLARRYNVGYKTFQKWITANKDLERIMKPYRYIRTIPPEIVKQIQLILGEP